MSRETKPAGAIGLLFDIGISEQVAPNETLAVKEVLTKFYQDFTERHSTDQVQAIRLVKLVGQWHRHGSEGETFLVFGLDLVAIANQQTVWEQSWSVELDAHDPESQTLPFRLHGECKVYFELDVFPPLFMVAGKDEEFSIPATDLKESVRLALEKVEQLSPQFASECQEAASAAENQFRARQNPPPDRKLN